MYYGMYLCSKTDKTIYLCSQTLFRPLHFPSNRKRYKGLFQSSSKVRECLCNNTLTQLFLYFCFNILDSSLRIQPHTQYSSVGKSISKLFRVAPDNQEPKYTIGYSTRFSDIIPTIQPVEHSISCNVAARLKPFSINSFHPNVSLVIASI